MKEKAKRLDYMWQDLRAPITDYGILSALKDVKYVIHLAAETHVDTSLSDSRNFVMTNVFGTSNLLECARRFMPNLQRFINFSTDEVYGAAPKDVYYKEWDTMRPSNPYAAAKAGQDMLAFSFQHAFKLPIITVRSMNIIGERQNIEKFVPKTIKAVLANSPVEVHGTPKEPSVRCWIHARNVAAALLYILRIKEPKLMYHVVGDEYSVADIAKLIGKTLNKKPLLEWKDAHSQRPGHDLRYALDGSLLKSEGYEHPVPFAEGFTKMVTWYQNPKHQKWLVMG